MQNGGENTKKVIIIGDGHVGKTCFVAKVTEGKFINNYHCTIGGENKATERAIRRSNKWVQLCIQPDQSKGDL